MEESENVPSPLNAKGYKIFLILAIVASLGAGWFWLPNTLKVTYHLQWGDLLWADEQYEPARDQYYKAYSIAAENPSVLVRMATVAGFDQKFSAQHDYLVLAIKEGNPYSASLMGQLAGWHLTHGTPVDALAYIDKALSLYPNNSRYHYQKAIVLRQLGQEEAARQSFENSVKLSRGDTQFRAFLKEQKEFKL